jgi:hypothetical protein
MRFGIAPSYYSSQAGELARRSRLSSDPIKLTRPAKPATIDEILTEEFIHPMASPKVPWSTPWASPRKHVNELCTDRRAVNAPTALILAYVFSDTPDIEKLQLGPEPSQTGFWTWKGGSPHSKTAKNG